MNQNSSRQTERPTIGWREWVHLPDLGAAIKAKVDTGALTSTIHAFDLREFTDRGSPMVAFQIHPRQRSARPSITVEAEIIDRRRVRNSGGRSERRLVVPIGLRLGEIDWTAEVTLACRDQMGFRMLIGRRSIRNRFVVDPGRSYVMGRLKSKPASTRTKRGPR